MKLTISNDTPIYKQIKEIIIDDARRKKLKAGDPIPTCRDISERLSVSTRTAQKAMSELVAEGVIAGRPGKGTFLIKYPRTGTRKRANSETFGLLFYDIFSLADPHLATMANGAQAVCDENGFQSQVLWVHGKSLFDSENAFITRSLHNQQLRGLLVSCPLPVKDLLRLKELGVPFVTIGNEREHPQWPQVLMNSEILYREATKTLIERGHEKIGLITVKPLLDGEDLISSESIQIAAYEEVLAEVGIQPLQEWTMRVQREAFSEPDFLSDLKTVTDNVTALVIGNANISKRIHKHLRAIGVNMDANSITAAWNDAVHDDFIPIHTPAEKLGEAATRLLLEYINGKKRKPTNVMVN